MVALALRSPAAFLGTLIGGMTAVPLGVLVNRARRLLKLGFGHADLEPAFKAEIERGREERAVDTGLGPSLAERALRAGSVAGWITFATSLAFGINPSWVFSQTSLALMTLGGFAGTGGLTGYLILLQQRRDVDAEFYAGLWTGPLGRMLFRAARLVTPQRMLSASVTHRPTELSIGMAAEQLYQDLPKETRRQLGDLPEVIHRLEGDAQRLRSRHEALAEAASRAGSGDVAGGGEGEGTSTDLIAGRRDEALDAVERERDEVRVRLSRTVAALETIRLSLLRLHAGSGTVESVTTDLGLAFEAAEDVNLLLQARREVDAELKAPPTP
jgi:hypothetical protein